MSRKNTKAMGYILEICRINGMEVKTLYERTRKLLCHYRTVCWSTMKRADMLKEEVEYEYGKDLNAALACLEAFSSNVEREKFDERVQSLFETRWLVELIESARHRVMEFPFQGELYGDILMMTYMSNFKYTESEILEQIGLERSSYFDRKKEAVLLMGITLWGEGIPRLQELLEVMNSELADTIDTAQLTCTYAQ